MRRFLVGFLSHPVWSGVGVILATVLTTIGLAIAVASPRSVPTDSRRPLPIAGAPDSSNKTAPPPTPHVVRATGFTVSPEFVTVARNAMRDLDKTTFYGTDFDYWPGGGLRNTYDHLRTFASYRDVARMSPVPVFLSGPHGGAQLTMNARFDFGHYNPAFVEWVDTQVSELCSDGAFIRASEPFFDKYLKDLIFTYWDTYRALAASPTVRDTLRAEYERGMANHNLPEAYYYNIAWDTPRKPALVKNLESRHDIGIVAPAVYFWLRRSIDGTDERFFLTFDKVLRAYDSTLVVNENYADQYETK